MQHMQLLLLVYHYLDADTRTRVARQCVSVLALVCKHTGYTTELYICFADLLLHVGSWLSSYASRNRSTEYRLLVCGCFLSCLSGALRVQMHVQLGSGNLTDGCLLFFLG